MNEVVFDSGVLPPLPVHTARPSQATQVEQARAIAEVRAAVMIAMDRPRDRTAAIAEMRELCSLMGLAERAFFRVKRGAEMVNGESIHLARELARIWGNVTYGVKELARNDTKGQSELLAFAWDLQTNARSEIAFIVPHVRGSGDKRRTLTGTQEIYENNASFAGRRLREAIFAILPVWFKAEAAEICHETLAVGSGGKTKEQTIADLLKAFEGIGVTPAQLEKKRGLKIAEFTGKDVAALRVIFGSIKREEVTVAEEFYDDDKPATPPANADAFEAASAGKASEPSPPEPQATPTPPDEPEAAVTQPEYAVMLGDGSKAIAQTPEEWLALWKNSIRQAECNLAVLKILARDNAPFMTALAAVDPEVVGEARGILAEAYEGARR